MSYYKDYHLQEIARWENGIPFDEFNHALNVKELYDAKRNQVYTMEQAVLARDLTSPYGALKYGVGDGDYFIVFDYASLPDGRIALHSIVNSESGGFIQDCDYKVVSPEDAGYEAQRMLDQAMDALLENDIEDNGWNDTGRQFVEHVKQLAEKG